MQDHSVLSAGMDSLVNSVEPLFLWCLKFQVDVTGETPHRTIYSDRDFWFQSATQPGDLMAQESARVTRLMLPSSCLTEEPDPVKLYRKAA